MVQRAHDIAVAHGFNHSWASVPEALALVHSEVSEVLEAHRRPSNFQSKEDQINAVAEELADVVIRVGDLAGALEIDLQKFIQQKMEFNEKRPYRNGKAY
jgi:NTP pyrophosphatase (non-canonical NTP hydrolase)